MSTSSAWRSCGCPIEQVARRIGAENVNLSGGRLEQGTQRFLVRTVNEFDTLEDMANSVIAIVDQQPVYLKDVARVERGYKDRTAITRLNGEECIELAIYKEGDANTVQLAHGIADKLESLGKTLPGGTKLVPVYDQSKFIASAVSDVKDAAILGGLLSILVLYFFLRDAWATIVTGVVIPVTVVGIFVMMYAFDLTLNVMSLGGIALSVGMLIDNSVVILEAIARRKEAGLSTIDAAREGTAEVATAVTASTLTSVAVFFPMVFVSGIAGQLFRDQALTVTFAQLISLMVGITLVPMLTAWRARLGEPVDQAPDAGEPRETLAALRRYLRGMLANINVNALVRPTGTSATQAPPSWLNAPWRLLRWIARRVAWSLRWLITFLVRQLRLSGRPAGQVAGRAAVTFRVGHAEGLQLPRASLSRVARLGAGTPCGRAVRGFRHARRHGADPSPPRQRADPAALAGRVHGQDASAGRLAARDHRPSGALHPRRGAQTTQSRQRLCGGGYRQPARRESRGLGRERRQSRREAPRAHRPGRRRARHAADARAAGGHPRRAVRIHPAVIAHALHAGGSDPRRLRSRAPLAGGKRLRDRMERSGAFRDIRSSIEGGHPEIQIVFDQERASQLGLAVRDIADRVVSNVRGSVATRYRLQEKKIDVLVRSVDTRAASIEEVRNLVVNPGSDRPVPLSAVAEVRLATGPAEIRRANQERVAVISAAPADGDLGNATREAQGILDATTLPVGILGSVSGQSEEMTQSFRSLGLAFALAVFLVYLVMASQFESLLHPFVILFTIPMGLIGSVWGLYITGTTINSVALIGLIMLAGIVVNNAIVLIDAINQARERGLQRIDAIKLAGRTRLRPILITSVSTIVGLIPMAIGIGEGAEIRRPMAITVIAGNLVATFLTLIVIPVLYAVMDRKEFVKATGGAAARPVALTTPGAPAATAHSPE